MKNNKYCYINTGKQKAESYIKELQAKRKEIMDAGLDTCDGTNLPTVDDILNDCELQGFDDNFEYWNSWGVTDNYDADLPICLKLYTDVDECDNKYELPENLIAAMNDNDFHITSCSDGVVEIKVVVPGSSYDGHTIFDLGYSVDEFAYNIRSYYEDYDVSYETYLWLDDSGHGNNGAPYDMRDLYNEMEEYQERIYELYQLVCRFNHENSAQ